MGRGYFSHPYLAVFCQAVLSLYLYERFARLCSSCTPPAASPDMLNDDVLMYRDYYYIRGYTVCQGFRSTHVED